ncbi:alpha/beta fold hydrolase [Streptomyces avermitilis]
MTLLHAHDYGGEGPQLVLLHGYGRSLADWDASAVLLTAGHRVLAVDLPGRGRSSGISPWTIPAVVRHIADTLDAHGVPEAVVVSHSLGGLVTVEYARANPGRARAAVNLDGFWWGREYPGADRVSEGLLASAGTIAPPEYIEEKVVNSARFGIPADRAEAAARAAARPLPDGKWQTLPERVEALEIRRTPQDLRAGTGRPSADACVWHGVVRRIQRPVCTRGLRGTGRALPPRPTISVNRIDAAHPMNLLQRCLP